MSKKPKAREIRAEFFTWRLFVRNGVYYADGRHEGLGKHSLSTRSESDALEQLRHLDRSKAEERGVVAGKASGPIRSVGLIDGWSLFMAHRNRPQVMGGTSAGTIKRYRAVRDKHIEFCVSRGLKTWDQVDRRTTEAYGSHLAAKEYADRTIYTELTLIVSVVKWLVDEGCLATSSRFSLPLTKPEGSDTYCYSEGEVKAIIARCEADTKLHWLRDIVVALALTGLRIGELGALRWTDIDWTSGTLRLTDERSSVRRKALGTVRTTKGKRGRSLVLLPSFQATLERMQRHPDGRIFHGPGGGKFKQDKVRRVFIRHVIEELKKEFPTPTGEIGFEHGRLHSFRHFFVTEAFRCGRSEAEIMAWVGHRDSKIVALYRHLRVDQNREQWTQLDFIGRFNVKQPAS